MSRDPAHHPAPDPEPRTRLRKVLRTRWPLAHREDLREELLSAWAGESRGYHDLVHLREVLDRLDELAAHHPHDRLPVQLAAWFHDAVHAGAPDDEVRSAAWAARALAGESVDVDEVVRLVLLTVAHDPAPDDRNGVVLCDADLAILAAAPERYAAYVAGVRREYAHVPAPAFAAGRAAVLRSFVDRPHVFSTSWARTRWEPAARANAAGELAVLEGTAPDVTEPGASGDAGPPSAGG